MQPALPTVLKEWTKYQKSLPRFALDALVETAELEWPKTVSTGGLLAVEQTPWAGARLGFALLAHKCVKVLDDYREHRNGPYRYLSRIQKARAQTQTALSIPARYAARCAVELATSGLTTSRRRATSARSACPRSIRTQQRQLRTSSSAALAPQVIDGTRLAKRGEMHPCKCLILLALRGWLLGLDSNQQPSG
jgi:hypothetical protein